jgi:[ribosomal protein S5]-alanine N-acetyltransferase
MSKAWPVTLRHDEVRLRPLRVRDAKRWQQLRASNHDWLAQWEATSPMPAVEPPPTFRQSARQMLTEARAGRTMPFVVEYQGAFVGQINVSDITYGSLRGCHFGYWIDKGAAGKGVMTTAAALVTDHLLENLKLHRIEIAIRPENIPSNRLAVRLGYGFEGIRPAFLHINNAWRDHNVYVMNPGVVPGGVLANLIKSRDTKA